MFRNTVLILSILLLGAASASAQFHFPPLSPRATLTQVVGTTNVNIEYDRPVARGREIFGNVVPYNEPWQTSGSSGVTISFDRAVVIDDQQLPAGKYALMTIPGEREWTIIIHDGNHGMMRYEKSEIRVQTCVPVKKPGRYYEALSLELDVSPNDATLYISWTDVQVAFTVNTSIERELMAYLDQLIDAPLEEKGDPYFRGANYLLFNQQYPEKALALIGRLQELDPGEYPYRMLIRANTQLGRKEAALRAVDDGIAAVKREYAGNQERIDDLVATYEEQRKKLLANTANGQKPW